MELAKYDFTEPATLDSNEIAEILPSEKEDDEPKKKTATKKKKKPEGPVEEQPSEGKE